MYATNVEIAKDVFNFSGQTVFETWKLRKEFEDYRGCWYSDWLVNEVPFSMQKVRDLADEFPYWQRRKKTGRPPVEERTLLISFMLRQFFKFTFRQTEGFLRMFKWFFQIEHVPDYTVMSRKNSSKRWLHLWRRFHKYVMGLLPERKVVVATDATGYNNLKRHWRDTDYGLRVYEEWIKVHGAIETDSFLMLNYQMTKAKVHESRMFETVWNDLPENVTPIRSLADSAYTSESCLQTAQQHGATPYHDVKSNAVHHTYPETAYEKLVNFATHWPNRFQKLYGKRNHIETTFSIITRKFGHKLRCKTRNGRKNEIQAKIIAHNIRTMAAISYITNKGV